MVRDIPNYPIKVLDEFLDVFPSPTYLVKLLNVESPLGITCPSFHKNMLKLAKVFYASWRETKAIKAINIMIFSSSNTNLGEIAQ